MAKRTTPPADWTLVIEDVTPLQSILKAVTAFKSKVAVKLLAPDGDGHRFLAIDCPDMADICWVSARLLLDGDTNELPDEDVVVCVDCTKMALFLDNPTCQHLPLSMVGRGDSVELKMRDTTRNAHEKTCDLRTYDIEENEVPDNMTFAFTIEFNVQSMKELLKQARRVRTEQMRIRVFMIPRGGVTVSVVTYSIEGDDFLLEEKFCNETRRDDDGSTVVRAVADGNSSLVNTDDLTPAYEGSFPVEKIDSFTKTINCSMLNAQVNTDMPIMFEHRIGGSSDNTSHIRFLVCPLNEA